MSLFTPAPLLGGFTPLAGATAWNPSDKTSAELVLSNSNLTATNTVSNTVRGVRAVQSRGSGKFYWEVRIDASVTGPVIGARSSGSSLTSIYPGTGFAILANGYIVYGASSDVTSPIGSYGAGDIIGVAVDLTAGVLYARKNGTWGTGQDPGAGTGGVSYGGTFTLFPHVYLGYNNDKLTANFGATPFVYPAPVGFIKGFA